VRLKQPERYLGKESHMTLQEKLDAYKADFVKQVPEDALAIMHRSIEDLRGSGIMARTVKVGDQAPDFELENTDGTTVILKSLLDRGPVVLGFYRGRW
jgi:hypothetical protein